MKFSSLIKFIIITVAVIFFLVTVIVVQREELQNYDVALQNASYIMSENSDIYGKRQDGDVNGLGIDGNGYVSSENVYSNDNASAGSNSDRAEKRIISYQDINKDKKYFTAKDSKVDYDILYMGMPISENVEIHKIDNGSGIDDTIENRKHYTEEYYSYKSDGYMRVVKTPEFAHPLIGDDSEKFFTISNTSTLAVSKNYDLMPRTMDFYFEESAEFFKKIDSYYEGKSLVDVLEPSMMKVDLNGDGNFVYLKLCAENIIAKLYNGDEGRNGIAYNFDVFDKEGNHIDTLLTVVSDVDVMEEYILPFDSLEEIDSVICADLDNDSKMEMIIEAPWYEFGLDIYTYKYEDGKMLGETGAIHFSTP